MSTQVVIVSSGSEHLRHPLLVLGELLRRRVGRRQPEAVDAELRQPFVHRPPHRLGRGLLVELPRRPRLDGALALELLRVPGRVAGPRHGPDRDVVDPDVVGMAVAAEGVVRRHDVGLVLADEPHEPAGRVVEIGLPEVPRIEVPRPAHHVGVAVAEVLPLGHAELAHRGLELAGPDLAEPPMVVGRVHLLHDDLAHLAAGAGDDDDAVAGLDGLGHRAAGADRLVVGVGMDRHERESVRVGHGRHGIGAGHRGVTDRWQDARRERSISPRRPRPRAWSGGRGVQQHRGSRQRADPGDRRRPEPGIGPNRNVLGPAPGRRRRLHLRRSAWP